MNAGCGQIEIFSESSREGLALQNEMMNGENQVKKLLKNKWNAHSSSEDGDE
jgi:hypothetical protein